MAGRGRKRNTAKGNTGLWPTYFLASLGNSRPASFVWYPVSLNKQISAGISYGILSRSLTMSARFSYGALSVSFNKQMLVSIYYGTLYPLILSSFSYGNKHRPAFLVMVVK